MPIVPDHIPTPTRENLHTSVSGDVMVDADHEHPLAGQLIGHITPGARDKWSFRTPTSMTWDNAPTILDALDALLFEALTDYPTASMFEWDKVMGGPA